MVDLTLPDAAPPPSEGPAGETAVPAADDGIATERLIARVRAWQHRNPLARRIAAREVVGIGVIALPYGPGEGPAGTMRPLYHQPKLLPGLSHRALVAFAERHAVRQRPGSPAWPQRDIERADATPEPAPETRYLLTAAIEAGPSRAGATAVRRLLLAPEGPAVWGQRPLSRPMLMAAAVVLAVVLAGVGWAARSALSGAVPAIATPNPLPAAPASAPSSVASAASVIASAAPTGPTTVPGGPSAATSPAAAVSAAPSAPAVAASPALAAVPLPSAPPVASAPARPAPAAAEAAASPPVPAAEAVSPPKLLPMPGARPRVETASAPASAAPAVAPGPRYALVSAPEKKRAAAEATLDRVHHLLGPAIGNLQAQVMPAPGGFVVTLWPLPTQADAEQLAQVLARRGVPMKWMEF